MTDMYLGKKLTYNPNKYYFNEENTRILEFLLNYSEIIINNYNYIDEPLKLNGREFNELLLKILKIIISLMKILIMLFIKMTYIY